MSSFSQQIAFKNYSDMYKNKNPKNKRGHQIVVYASVRHNKCASDDHRE
jgi:hypothetical protein